MGVRRHLRLGGQHAGKALGLRGAVLPVVPDHRGVRDHGVFHLGRVRLRGGMGCAVQRPARHVLRRGGHRVAAHAHAAGRHEVHGAHFEGGLRGRHHRAGPRAAGGPSDLLRHGRHVADRHLAGCVRAGFQQGRHARDLRVVYSGVYGRGGVCVACERVEEPQPQLSAGHDHLGRAHHRARCAGRFGRGDDAARKRAGRQPVVRRDRGVPRHLR